jgi:LysR family transcriptional regulator, regulator for metE and metH
MEIRHLKLIKVVSEEGTLSRAVNKLLLSQSALSHQLKEIETLLGTPVFYRVNKKLVLTENGKVLLKCAQTVLHELEHVEMEIRKRVSGESGKLRLATECYTCYHWLPAILKKFSVEFPNVEIAISTEDTTNPHHLLLHGKVDLALIHRKKDEKSIQYTELFKDELVAVVPATHPWANRKSVSAKDFAKETLITHTRKVEQSVFYEKVLIPEGIRPRKVIYIQITEAAIEMVNAGLGIAVMAGWLIKPYIGNQKVKAVRINRGLFRVWYIAVVKQQAKPAFLNYFVQQLKQNQST